MVHKNLNSKDHFYSQTCLRHFSSSPDQAFIYRKKENFSVKEEAIESICLERGGDICESYENIFCLREILDIVEPTWNIFIEAIKNRNIDEVHFDQSRDAEIPFLEKVSLFIAYLRCLSPTILRLLKEQHEEILSRYILPLSADLKNELDEETRTLIKKGVFKVEVGNKKYYKNQILKNLVEMARNFYNRDWEILVNNTDIKFITSDTPFISLENGSLYLPLTPEYVLIIKSHSSSDQIEYKSISRTEVENYNKEIVKWAARLVVSSVSDPGISRLVEEYRNHKVENEITSIQEAGAIKIFSRHKIIVKEN